MKKKFLGIISALALGFSLVSCDEKVEDSSINTSTEENINAGNSEKENLENLKEKQNDKTPIVLKESTLWVVGDSTVSSFTDNYYLPRFGYGTKLNTVLDSKITVNNLALSGRSSRSFLKENNYETLKNGIKKGDYLVIGFGHNDEKNDDNERYAAPNLDSKDIEKDLNGDYNFQYILNEYYIDLAKDCGATPILCTPIVRLNEKNDYSGSSTHITSTGDYPECIKDLGLDTETTVIDLTGLTKEKYKEVGYDNAKKYHAVTSCKYDTDGTTIIPNYASLDSTHINNYGALEVSYLFANELKETSNTLSNYVLSDIKEPTIYDYNASINKAMEPLNYEAYNWSNYNAASHFKTSSNTLSYDGNVVAKGLYGTAFGDTGGDPSSSSNGYVAKEASSGIYNVGQAKSDGSFKGKISGSVYGLSFLFYQVDKNYNFTMTVDAKIINQTSDDKQAGFGLMLRDDCYIPTNDKAIVSNYVAAGLVSKSAGSMVSNFSEVNGARLDANSINKSFVLGDTASFKIKRLGQVVTCETTYNGNTYVTTYTDFDFTAIDSNYMYIGMFGARGIIAEFSNLNFTIDSIAMGA